MQFLSLKFRAAKFGIDSELFLYRSQKQFSLVVVTKRTFMYRLWDGILLYFQNFRFWVDLNDMKLTITKVQLQWFVLLKFKVEQRKPICPHCLHGLAEYKLNIRMEFIGWVSEIADKKSITNWCLKIVQAILRAKWTSVLNRAFKRSLLKSIWTV